MAALHTDPVRFGILGCGRIALNALAPAIRAVPDAVLAAAASRDPRRAQALMPLRAHASYAALVADPDVEAVLIASHNGDHRPWTIAALAAGKHVLCEKPLGCNPQEVRDMGEAAARAGRHLVEAFMYRFHPQLRLVQEAIASGEIGDLRRVDAVFTFQLGGADDVRLRPEWGGGALLDVGCYCADFIRSILGPEPQRIAVERARFHPGGADLHVKARLEYPGGAEASLECGFDAPFAQAARVTGARGALLLEQPWVTARQRPRVVLDGPAGRRTLDAGFPDPYRLEIEHMARLVRGLEAPRFPLADTLATARILERVAAESRTTLS